MRNPAIQYIRIVAMLVIVMFHCACYYGVWHGNLQSAHVYEHIGWWQSSAVLAMNAFVFIAGVLYASGYKNGKYRDSKHFISGKVCRLIAPYLIWGLLAVLLFPAQTPWLDYLSGVQHLWFLLMTFVVYVVMNLLGDKMLKNSILLWGGICCA